MNSIAFIDTEIEPRNQKILDIGGIKDNGNFFHSNSVAEFKVFDNRVHFVIKQEGWQEVADKAHGK